MTRLQLQLKGAAEDLFNNMLETLRLKPSELVLDALALMHFAMEQVSQGKKVGSYDPTSKEFTGMTTAALESIASRIAKIAVPAGAKLSTHQ